MPERENEFPSPTSAQGTRVDTPPAQAVPPGTRKWEASLQALLAQARDLEHGKRTWKSIQ